MEKEINQNNLNFMKKICSNITSLLSIGLHCHKQVIEIVTKKDAFTVYKGLNIYKCN